MKPLPLILIFIIAFSFPILNGCNKEKPKAVLSPFEKLAKINLADAQTLALKQTQGKVLNGRLELENGLLAYSFFIETPGGRQMEVMVNALDGTIISVQGVGRRPQLSGLAGPAAPGIQREETLEEYQYNRKDIAYTSHVEIGDEHGWIGSLPVDATTQSKGRPVIDQHQAETAAGKIVGGQIRQIALKNMHGYLVYDISDFYENTSYEVIVDAGNGEVLTISTN
jgi:uncharacterized membrane protein YkoI